VKTIEPAPGVRVHIIEDRRFKTVLIAVLPQTQHDERAATCGTLLSHYVSRGTANFPDPRDLQLALADAYGAEAGLSSSALGRREVLLCTASCLSDRHVPDGVRVAERTAELMRELFRHPRAEGDALHPAQLEQARAAHAHQLARLINNKDRFAHLRCLKLMAHEGETFGIHSLGSAEALESLTPEELHVWHHRLLARSQIDLFFAGDIDESGARRLADLLLDGIPRETPEELFRGVAPVPECLEHRLVEETMDVQQGKLCMGYRLSVEYEPRPLAAHMIAMSIFGVDVHSRLFRQVRERDSLCYSIGVRPDLLNGIFVVHAGIDFSARDRVVEAVDDILRDLRRQGPTTEELDTARAMVLNDLLSTRDSPRAMIRLALRNLIAGKQVPIEELIAATRVVNARDVQDLLESTCCELVYFLRGDKQ